MPRKSASDLDLAIPLFLLTSSLSSTSFVLSLLLVMSLCLPFFPTLLSVPRLCRSYGRLGGQVHLGPAPRWKAVVKQAR